MNVVKGKIKPIRDNVLVTEMEFEETTTASGIFIPSQNGKNEGIKPRWGRVWAIGPEQQDVDIGDWIYVEHGRWTRKVTIDDGEGVKDFQKVETKSILLVADERPNDFYIGTEYGHGDTATIRPEDFGAR